MYGLWSDNIENLESEGANNPNIEKISFLKLFKLSS